MILKGLQTLSRSYSTGVTKNVINNVTVIGGGLMGTGIAQVAAQASCNVNLVDLNDKLLANSQNIIQQSLQRISKKLFKDDPVKGENFVKSTFERINFNSNVEKSVEKTDLVIEAIIENLALKQKLFSQIDKCAPEHAIFTSNTSSIPITEIAIDSKRKDRFGGLHFFNPVPMMKLLEVIRINETSDETFEKMTAWGKFIGKVTVSCKDTPGFIVNRLLIPYSMEAIRMVERGDASFEDIDVAMKLGAGYPMGPFELSDYTGIDLGLNVIKGWHERFPNDPMYKVPKITEKMVAEGKFGRKSGEGWYKYGKK